MRTSVIFIFGLLAIVAKCQEEEEPEPPPMEDGDGMDEEPPPDDAPPAEIDEEKLKAIHAAMDTNNDGKVTKDEMHAFTTKAQLAESKLSIGDQLQEMDKDKDGKVSKDEYMKDMEGPMDEEAGEMSEEDKKNQQKYLEFEKEKFKVADRDKDGFLNADEMHVIMSYHLQDDMLTLVAQNEIKQRDTDGNGELTSQEFWMPGEEEDPDMKEEFAKIDKDGSGSINLNEFKAYESGQHYTDIALTKLLELTDQDNDGQMSLEEFTANPSLHEDHELSYHLQSWATHAGHGGEL